MVILGSGLDCRPLRLQSCGARWWEVDRAAVLDHKVRALRAAGITYPSPLVSLLRVDYLQVDLCAELAAAGVDLAAPVLFLWEGNTMYLPPDKSRELVRQLFNRVPQATLAFDTNSVEIAGPTAPQTGSSVVDAYLRTWFELAAGGRNIWPGAWDPVGWADGLGYEVLESTGCRELMLRYRGGEKGVRKLFDGCMDFYNTIMCPLSEFYRLNIVRTRWRLTRRPSHRTYVHTF